MYRQARKILFVFFAICGLAPHAYSDVRIKDVVELQGVRDNQLLGYGLVVGLNATGDSLRNAPFTEASIKAMLDQLGIGRTSDEFRTRNVAAVMVTAKLPAFANKGTRIDVNVSSIGDASSLRGGTLVFTPLYGGDGKIYASAQGGLVVSGFSVEGDAADVDSSTPTAARVPNGAIVEMPAPGSLNDEKLLVLQLSNPDFDTAIAIVDRINQHTLRKYNRKLAEEVDHRSIAVHVPPGISTTRFYASFGQLTVKPDTPARIVVDERTGTVIIGSKVTVSEVAITHGGLTVSVTELPEVSQPLPFSEGETVVTPNTQIEVFEEPGSLGIVDAPTLQQLVNGLNMMGAKPTSIIAILQGIKSAGALQADLVVQ
ncbi:MAG: flagellar basal body P-ring protein FlgI [Rhizobiaceae bacterium]|jgi:flagellar P-ring protein precursor FlgI|nr:flagellar basal body P-ring protein FlgI [Rhizobiaceae bacterium]